VTQQNEGINLGHMETKGESSISLVIKGVKCP